MVTVTPTCWRYYLPERRHLHETFCPQANTSRCQLLVCRQFLWCYFRPEYQFFIFCIRHDNKTSHLHHNAMDGKLLEACLKCEFCWKEGFIVAFTYVPFFEWLPAGNHVICFSRDFMFFGPPQNDNSFYVMLFRVNMVRLSCKRYFIPQPLRLVQTSLLPMLWLLHMWPKPKNITKYLSNMSKEAFYHCCCFPKKNICRWFYFDIPGDHFFKS